MTNIVYVATAHVKTDVEVDYNLYVGRMHTAAKNAAVCELKLNPNAVSVRIVKWDMLFQKASLVETLYKD